MSEGVGPLHDDSALPALDRFQRHEEAVHDGRLRRASDARIQDRLQADGAGDVAQLWVWDLAPGDIRDGDSHRPGTKEIVHVQRGRLAVIVGADREDLGPGRVAIYAGDRPHRFENPGSTVARFALFAYEPVR